MSASLSWMGRGWGFPITVADGALPVLDGPEKVRQSIMLILDTDPGERLMLPTFGAGLRRYLAEPNSVAVRALMQRDVELAVTTWEPRVRLDAVEVFPGEDPAMVLIAIAYTHVRDGRPDNLVYPFALS
jgi:phage baseplate assembly protein W